MDSNRFIYACLPDDFEDGHHQEWMDLVHQLPCGRYVATNGHPNPRVLAFKMEGKPNLGTGDCIRQATIAGCEVDVYVIGEEIV